MEEEFDHTIGEESCWKVVLELPQRNCGPDNDALPTDPECGPWPFDIPGPVFKHNQADSANKSHISLVP